MNQSARTRYPHIVDIPRFSRAHHHCGDPPKSKHLAETGPDARYPEQSFKSRSRRADPRVFGLRPEHLARLGRRDRRRAGMPSPGVIGQDVCLLAGHVGAWIIVPACVRILYATACETEQIPTGSGGSGPCPAVCACPGIRGSTYCPRMGRGDPSAMRRMPRHTQAGITAPGPARKHSNRRMMYAVNARRGTFEPPRTP